MNSNKYIIICGHLQTGNELNLIRSLGYKSILINSNTWIDLEKAIKADVPVEVNLNDHDKVIEKIKELEKKYNIVAVFSLNEYRVPLAAKIKEFLKLPYGLSYDAAMKCRNKKDARKVLKGLGENSVKHAIIRNLIEAKEFISQNGLPVVIKPSNDAGSQLVACCTTILDVEEAVDNIISRKTNLVNVELDSEFLIEEFLDGPEFSVETITYRGKSKVVAITSKKILSSLIPLEIGHTVPAILDSNIEEDIENIVIRSHELLGINDTVTHTEIKVTRNGPRIIEVNARPGGDNIPSLVKAVTGVDLHAASILLALGKNVTTIDDCNAKKADIRYFIAEEDGYAKIGDLSELYNNDNVKKIDLPIEQGMKVQKSTSNYDRIGYFMCFDEDDETIDKMMNVVKVQENPLNEILTSKDDFEEDVSKKEDLFENMILDCELENNLSNREYAIAVLMRALSSDSEHKKVRAVIYAKSIGISTKEINNVISSLSEIDQILHYESNAIS